MLLSFLPLTKTVSKGKNFVVGERVRRSDATHRWLLSHWVEASRQLPKGGARGPGFVPSPRVRTAAPCCTARAAGPCVRGRRAVFEENPCCFRPCRVSDHYILAFNSLLLFIDFDNYSGLRKKKGKKKKKPTTHPAVSSADRRRHAGSSAAGREAACAGSVHIRF